MTPDTSYDLIIIGGGPGGVAAGVYAARKKIKTLLITDSFGGQSIVSTDIQNWIGTKSISGFDLAKSLEAHVRSHDDGSIEIIDNDLVAKITQKDGFFELATRNSQLVTAKYILVTSGSRHKNLDVLGEKEFNGKGVVYCATCDAPLFGEKAVVVVGGGNSALEAAIDLFPYASKIYILVRSDVLKGDPITQDKVKSHPNVEIIMNGIADEIIGKEMVTGLKYHTKTADTKETTGTEDTGEKKELAVEGVFVEIGLTPNSDFLNGVATLNSRGEIVTDPRTQETSTDGIWAAGDVTDCPYRQNNISVGDAIKAVLNIYDHLKMEQ